MSARTLVRPAYISVPDYHHTYGPEVADLGRMVGFEPDAEQELVLDGMFGVDRFGQSVAFEVAVIACRQNLKTGVQKLAALGQLYLTDQRLVVWSAHEFSTAAEAFRDLDILVDGSDFLRRRVKAIHRGNGDEAIELVDDRRLIFKARTKSGGRGLSGDKVYLDEAMFLQPGHMGTLMPTLSARPDPQLFYGASAELATSLVQRGVRRRGRAGKGRLAYYEWCAPDPKVSCAAGEACTHALDADGCGCDRQELWQLANPAMGRRITLQYIQDERNGMPPAEFGRERMGWHDDPVGGLSPMSEGQWTACLDAGSTVLDPVAMGVSVAPDRTSAAIAVAGRRADVLTHGELIEHRPGTGWLLTRIKELAGDHGPCVLVINPTGAAGSLEKSLIEAGWTIENDPEKPTERRLHLTGGREYAQACGALVDDVINERFRHLEQKPLGDAVKGVMTRPLADAYAWSHEASAPDITPLEALTLACFGHAAYGVTTPPDPFFA